MRRSCCLRICAMAALTALLGMSLRADTVYLVGGGSYKGKVRMEGDRVVVELAEGMIVLDRESVLRIEPGDDLGTQLADRRARLDAKDADGHYRLGQWAAQNNLVSPARELFAKAISIQPGHIYFYQVTAVDLSNNESQPCEEVEVEARN